MPPTTDHYIEEYLKCKAKLDSIKYEFKVRANDMRFKKTRRHAEQYRGKWTRKTRRARERLTEFLCRLREKEIRAYLNDKTLNSEEREFVCDEHAWEVREMRRAQEQQERNEEFAARRREIAREGAIQTEILSTDTEVDDSAEEGEEEEGWQKKQHLDELRDQRSSYRSTTGLVVSSSKMSLTVNSSKMERSSTNNSSLSDSESEDERKAQKLAEAKAAANARAEARARARALKNVKDAEMRKAGTPSGRDAGEGPSKGKAIPGVVRKSKNIRSKQGEELTKRSKQGEEPIRRPGRPAGSKNKPKKDVPKKD